VAVFSKADLDRAVESCPWVGDELAEVADTHLAFAGAVLGPLGHSLDEMFRFMVLEKCVVKRKEPRDVIAVGGKAMDGMYILGGGSLEVVDEGGNLLKLLSMGDFVFPDTVLSAAPAAHTVRAGARGALVLYAPRKSAHELLATCPPFIELLAG
jgi:signal-transduction protein with cAMP-binding, CBS, and nucleotidyltransferase domain